MRLNTLKKFTLIPLLFCGSAYAENLDRSLWTLSASNNTAGLQSAIDNSDSSRWTTQTRQSAGQYIEIDLGQVATIDQVELNSANSSNDYPRNYAVYTSLDGDNWGSAVASGSGNAVTNISFSAVKASHVKIEQTGSDSYYWWSIHELNVNGGVEELVQLDSSNWSLSSKTNNSGLELAIDGNASSRWTSQTPQVAGQELVIDFNDSISFDRIILNNEQSALDYPRRYSVRVSDDGNTWVTVLKGDGSTEGQTIIDFDQQTSRYLKLKQLGSDTKYWWSIHELELYQKTQITNPGGGNEAGNCTGTYDLPKCMDEMSANGGGTIVLAAKTYKLTESLILKDKVNIVGQGYDTVITWDDAITSTIDEPLFFASAVNDISLSHLKMRCHIDQSPTSNDLRNDHMAIFLYGGGDPSVGEATSNNNIHLDSIEAVYCSHGIHLKGVTNVTASDLKLHHNGNTEIDLFHNIYYRRVANLTVTQTDSNSGGYYSSPRGHGIRGSHLKNVYFENLSVFDNADHGIHFDAVYDVRFNNLHVEGNCANPSGGCNSIQCYGDCDIDYDADKE